jgi:hypothetical protein
LGWWDAERSDLITQSGGLVSAWADVVGGYSAVQSISGQRPAYSATSFNNRPGITFDGVDDCVEMAAAPASFPTGSTGCEIWALVDQLTPSGDATARRVAAYGGTTTASARALARASGNQAQAPTGDGTTSIFPTNSLVAFTGRHVVRAVFTPTSAKADVDDVANGVLATSLNTSAGKWRIGANTAATAGAFSQIVASAVLVTGLLTAPQATQLYTYLNARKA